MALGQGLHFRQFNCNRWFDYTDKFDCFLFSVLPVGQHHIDRVHWRRGVGGSYQPGGPVISLVKITLRRRHFKPQGVNKPGDIKLHLLHLAVCFSSVHLIQNFCLEWIGGGCKNAGPLCCNELVTTISHWHRSTACACRYSTGVVLFTGVWTWGPLPQRRPVTLPARNVLLDAGVPSTTSRFASPSDAGNNDRERSLGAFSLPVWLQLHVKLEPKWQVSSWGHDWWGVTLKLSLFSCSWVSLFPEGHPGIVFYKSITSLQASSVKIMGFCCHSVAFTTKIQKNKTNLWSTFFRWQD